MAESTPVVKLMKQTGLAAAEIGADAASDIALSNLGKNFSFSDVISTNEDRKSVV